MTECTALKAIFEGDGARHFGPSSSLSDASPLYEFLSAKIASDEDLLELALQVVNTPMPLVFLGSVQYLLSKYPEHPLRGYYASYRDPPMPIDSDTLRHFKEFVLSHKAELVPLLRTRLVQTNEVRRCALLLPALHKTVQQLSPPYAFIEFGSSAGLNLLPDHYAYRFAFADGRSVSLGDPSATVQLHCEVRGAELPLPSVVPSATHRIGIDLLPLDVASDDNVQWLKSLIWPEHRERRERLTRVVEIARRHPVQHLEGDVVVRLREAFARIPPSESIIMWHSFVLNQIPSAVRDSLYALMKELSLTRTFVEIGVEFVRADVPPVLTHTRWHNGEKDTVHMAECSAHGTWIRMLGGDKAT